MLTVSLQAPDEEVLRDVQGLPGEIDEPDHPLLNLSAHLIIRACITTSCFKDSMGGLTFLHGRLSQPVPAAHTHLAGPSKQASDSNQLATTLVQLQMYCDAQ
jgi:hypothetical protein